MKLHRVTRGTPIIEPVYSKHGKDCLAACVATLTGQDIEKLDKAYKGAWREIKEGKFSMMEAVRHWIDAVNEVLWMADSQYERHALRGPFPVQPIGLGIAVCQAPLADDPASHAVVTRAWPGKVLEIVHDPGFAPYTFDPESFFFLQLTTLESEHGEPEFGFTDALGKLHPEIIQKYDDPPA